MQWMVCGESGYDNVLQKKALLQYHAQNYLLSLSKRQADQRGGLMACKSQQMVLQGTLQSIAYAPGKVSFL